MAQPASKRLVTEANITDPNSVAGAVVVATANSAVNAVVGGKVDAAVAEQMSEINTQVEAAQGAAGQAQVSADASAQTADSRIAAGLASGGVIKAADDATLSAAKSYADSGVAQVNTWFLRGNGSPVGIITPTSAGVQYVDLAATNGAGIWVSTGTTRTSWRVVQGDTGWRYITALLAPALGGQSVVRVRRSNDMVVCALSSINASPTTKAFFTLPTGFNPGSGTVTTALFPSTPSALATAGGHLSVPWDGVNAFVVGTSAWCDGFITWATLNNWPTTLPGTPA